MPVEITCAGCQRKLRVGNDAQGKKIKCPECFTINAPPDPAAGSSAAGAAATATGSRQPTWHVKTSDGRVYGPVIKYVVDQWVSEGRIDGNSQLLQEGSGQWQWAGTYYPHLSAHTNPYGAPTSYAPQYSYSPPGPSDGSGIVATVAVCNFVAGAMLFFGGYFSLTVGAAFMGMCIGMSRLADFGEPAETLVRMRFFAQIFGAGFLMLALMAVIAGVGIVMRTHWGRVLTMVTGGLSILAAIAHFGYWSVEGRFFAGTDFLFVIYGALVCILLMQRDCSRHFR